jgi:hypothetical protein
MHLIENFQPFQNAFAGQNLLFVPHHHRGKKITYDRLFLRMKLSAKLFLLF